LDREFSLTEAAPPAAGGASKRGTSVAAALGEPVGRVPAHIWSHVLHGPLAEFLSRPGKEFRRRLVELGYRLAGGRGEVPETLSLVVEILHAGSLIIDDIEDEATVRRGAPALHRVHGVPRALNAGNWLYFWPFALLARLGVEEAEELALSRLVSEVLLHSHYGQALDLGVRVTDLAPGEVAAVVETSTRLRTGALFELALGLGALHAHAAPDRVAALRRLGVRFGTALQMADDLGSLTAENRRHKGLEDIENQRPTWPWAWLVEESGPAGFTRCASELTNLTEPSARSAFGERLGEHVLSRGRAAITRQGRRALGGLRATFGESAAAVELAAEITRLERSFF
jgi:geranylgeranyl pyrophosphate synthase